MTLLFDVVLALLLLLTAFGVVTTGTERPAVLAFMGYGLLLGLVWVRLAAPDVAMTEIAIGSGISGIVLLRAARSARSSPHLPATPRTMMTHAPGTKAPGEKASGEKAPDKGVSGRKMAALVSVGVTVLLGGVVLALPTPAPSLAPQAAEALPSTGLGNPVTGVLLVFRGLDTLLEKMVLLLALIGVWALARDPLWRGAPAPLFPGIAPAPSAFLARVLAPIGVLVGIYLLWAGADDPGGAFQSGATLAAMVLLLMMGGLVRAPALGSRALRLVVLGGPFAFLAVGFLGWASAGTFLAYPPGFEKAVIKAVEVAITASIALTLVLVVLGPSAGEERP